MVKERFVNVSKTPFILQPFQNQTAILSKAYQALRVRILNSWLSVMADKAGYENFGSFPALFIHHGAGLITESPSA